MSLIELEIIMNLKNQPKEPKEIRPLLQNIWATHLLHKIAEDKVASMPLYDELDFHLGFLLGCKEILERKGIALPFTSEHMRFFGITGIKQTELEEATRQVIRAITAEDADKELIDFLFLENDLIANFSYQFFERAFEKEIKEIKEKRDEQLSSFDESEGATSAKAMKDFEEIQQWVKEEYAKLLASLK